MTRQMITIDQFLTDAEIASAQKLYRTARPGTFAQRCAAEIITPQIERINQALGQENDALYLAYCVEYVIGKVSDGA
jgi:hypothetical protein